MRTYVISASKHDFVRNLPKCYLKVTHEQVLRSTTAVERTETLPSVSIAVDLFNQRIIRYRLSEIERVEEQAAGAKFETREASYPQRAQGEGLS